jgi:hypothetical protein
MGQRSEQPPGGGGQFGRLERDAVPGGNRADERGKNELKRVVPGSQNQDDPERLRTNATPGGEETEIGSNPFRLRPGSKMPESVADLLPHEMDFTEISLGTRLAQIALESGENVLLPTADRIVKPQKRGPSLRNVPKNAPIETLAESRDDGLRRGFDLFLFVWFPHA